MHRSRLPFRASGCPAARAVLELPARPEPKSEMRTPILWIFALLIAAPAFGEASANDVREPADVLLAQRASAADRAELQHTFDPGDEWGLVGLPVRGNPEALVTIVVFSDFQCPYCSRVVPTLDRIAEQYPDDVRVVFVQMPLSFHTWAHDAAQASLAAHAQGRFWEFHDLLFDESPRERPDFADLARRAGADPDAVQAALDAGTYAEAVDAQIALASRLGIRGTPNFRINGRSLRGAQPYGEFEDAVEAELTAVRALLDSGSDLSAAYAARLRANDEPEVPTPPARPTPDSDDWTTVTLPGDPAFRGGGTDPLVTIVEFTDYQCPYCQRAHDTIEALLAQNPDVRVVVSHYPLSFHDRADEAAIAAIAAEEQGRFWDFHDALFERGTSNLSEADLEEVANELGLDVDAWNAARASTDARDRLASDMERASEIGVTGTPQFVVNGQRVRGAQSLETFQAAVDAGRERAQGLLEQGVEPANLYDALMENLPGAEDEEPAAVEIDTSAAPSLGAHDAPIEFVVFTDFQCPFCVRFAPTALAVTEQHPDVRLVIMHFPLGFHQDAELAAQAAVEAQEQGLFWEFFDAAHAHGTSVGRAELETLAASIGMDVDALRAALDDERHLERVQAEMAAGTSAGVRGTPSWFLNGVFHSGAHPQEYVEDAIQTAREARAGND